MQGARPAGSSEAGPFKVPAEQLRARRSGRELRIERVNCCGLSAPGCSLAPRLAELRPQMAGP